MFGENKLSGKDMDELKKLVWDNDGKQIAELEGIDKFLTDEELESGRTTIKANPEWYEGYDKWLSRQPGSDAVKKAMNKRSMDAKDLVEKSGVNAPYISKLLNGKIKEPTWAKACAIIDALGMTVDEFRDFQSERYGDSEEGE